MDITTGMESFQRFQDEGYKNWIKTTMGLQYLKTRLGSFLENETETYHQSLRNKINRNGLECQTKCDFKKGDLKKWTPTAKKVPPTCVACVPWRDEIWANHSKSGMVYWNNCTPYLWPTEKWEVAKVYMGRGNTSHKKVGDFDISAFLNLMTNCLHFKQFAGIKMLTTVTNVRNQVMHSANFRVKKEDLESHLDRIRGLGKALEKHTPEFQALAKEIDELQNIDFNLILCRAESDQGFVAYAADEETLNLVRAQQFLHMELHIMKEKMECLAQLYEGDRENVLTLEDLQCVKGFLEGNRDLQERLLPQWERLREVQEQQGEQLDSLTGRVDELEKRTVAPEQKSEFSTDIVMYKNFLFEDARKHGWPEPVFCEKRESTGYRGQLMINGKTFTGIQVCRSKTQAHQEVAKIALEELAKETDNNRVDIEASVSQTHQSESVSPAGSSFFGSVTVVLDTKVVPDEGSPGTPEAVESAYKKLAPLFGLELSESASSYKEAVLQYCQRRDVPPPKEIGESDCFSLRVNGPITFHDSEGSSNKKQAQRQAAKAALQGLCGVLGKKEVLEENYVGALKELLDARKLERVVYDVTARAGGVGEGGRSVRDEEKDGGGRRDMEEVGEGRGEGRGEHDELSEREKRTGGAGGPHQVPVTFVTQMGRSANNEGPKPSRTDTSISMETQATPATPEEKSILEGYRGQLMIDGKTFTGIQVCTSKTQAHQEVAKIALEQLAKETANNRVDVEASVSQTNQSESVSPAGSSFFGSVTVVLDTEVVPDEGCPGTPETVESAYKKLAPLFGLELSESASSYKEAVLQYCQRRDVPPPKEIGESDCFSLRVNGPITFHDSEGSSNKKQAQRQAAKVALQGLCGVLGKKEVLEENYVGALKELLDARKLERVVYDVTARAGGVGEGGRSVRDEEKDGQGGRRDREEVSEGRGEGRGEHAVDELSEREKRTGGAGGPHQVPVTSVTQMGRSANNEGPKPSRTDTSISMETQATPATPEEKSILEDGRRFLGCVKVAIKKELAPCEASSQEGAVQAAYRSLLHALSLGTSAGEEKQAVMEFFTQTKCCPPMEELVTTTEGIHRCTLKIDGKLNFQSPEGAAKKQQAEQLAAKEALRHLGGLLGGKSSNLSGDNCKGSLQELLAKHGSGAMPEYSTTDRPALGIVTAPGQVTEVSSVIGTIQQADAPSVSHAVTMDSAHEDSEQAPSREFAEMQSDGPIKEVRQYLAFLGLQPQSVVCEGVSVEQQYEWRVCVSFEDFTLRNDKLFDTKRDASRSSFLTLGLAGEICQPEESKAKEKVNQFFSRHSFPLPKEAFQEPEPQKFSCSLTGITCVFTYTAKDFCEGSARQSACHRALSSISPLIGYCGPVVLPTSTKEVELRLRTLLEGAGLKLSDSIHTVEYRSSATLKFSGYCMETKGQGTKRETRNKLSERLLKLLQGEETLSTNKNQSMKYVLDMWFSKSHLDKPVFEDTDNMFGTRVTFSAPLHCSYTDWQDSQEKAVKRLVEELQRRVQNLSD